MKKVKICFLILFCLLITRFLDLSLIWNLNRLDSSHFSRLNSSSKFFIKFIGFSSKSKAEKYLEQICREKSNQIMMVNYFDYISPSIYLIKNRGEADKFFSPLNLVSIEPGNTQLKYYKFDVMQKSFNGKSSHAIVCFYGSIFSYFVSDNNNKMIANNLTPDLSFLSHYLGKITIVYFFLPLLIISLLGFFWSKKYFVCFYYYPIMILLFSTPLFIWNPLGLLNLFEFELYEINLTMLRILHIFAVLVNLLIYFYIVYMIRIGHKNFNFKNSTNIEKTILLYFLLLPFILRF
jgi:hypothetical protein